MNSSLEQIEFEQIADFRNGLNFGKTSHGIGCLLIGIPDFKDRFLPDYKSLGQINPIGIAKDDDYLQEGDILFVRSNGNKDLVGRSLFIDKKIKALYSGFCIRARLTNELITPLFCAYYTRTDFFKSQISSSGGTNIQNLNQEILSKVKLPLFSLKEQGNITQILSDLDAKIELNKRINAELEQMAKTLYDYWFVQFDFLNAQGKPYKSSGGKMEYNTELKREIPENWEVKKFGELVYQVTDSISHDEYPELPYLPIDKLPMKQLYYNEYESRSEANSSLIRFKENDILLGAMRVYFHRVCHAISDGISRSTIIVLRPFKVYFKNFALFALNKNEAIEFATNNSTGTSIPYAKWNDSLENYLIAVPKTDDILILFNKIVDPILDKFKIQNKQTQQLIELRDWLLPMLMNGQVKVGEMEREAELNMAAEPEMKYGK